MIRSRLTKTVVALIAVVLVVFAASVFWTTRSGVLAELERDVTGRADAVARSLEQDQDGVPDETLAPSFGAPDVVVAVYDATGRRLTDSGTLPERTPEPVDLAGFDLDDVGVHEIDLDGPLYVTHRTVTATTGSDLTIIVGRSPTRLYEALGRLLAVLVPATALTLLVTGVAVFYSLRRALQPLEALDEETRRVADSGDHRARIVGRYRPDEVGALARSVDSMLASLAEQHEQAQAATRSQREFLADVSHELRAPLAVVTSSVELARRVADDDPGLHDQLLDDALSELARMARIVSQLLLMARTGAELSGADRPLLVSELVADAGRRWAAATDDVTIDAGPLAPIADVVIQGNGDHLAQVFDVLLDNAVKFTPPPGRIDLRGRADGGTVSIEVRDTGVGIEPEHLDRVFERFVHGPGGGTGLGLAIARHVVERHGGTIQAAAPRSGGTSITVELPILGATHDLAS